ncbi:MAG: hypothetical protein V4604_05380 [Bacteroidota bacterium]
MKLPLLILFLCFASFLHAQTDTTTTALERKIFALNDRVINDPSLQTDHFSSGDSSSLPIGIVRNIGNVIYAICIDSAYYTPDGAYFNAYMAMDFPGCDRKIAFYAKNVHFNPQGVIVSQGARLQLASEKRVNLGPNAHLVFKNDGNNFIEWDCNGYKQAGLSLDFVFNPEIIINATNPALPVKASLQLVVEDLQNISINIPSVDPFRVKGAEDFIFALSDVSIDRSSSTNPQGIILPAITEQLYVGDVNEWKGFYARSIVVTLPPKLSRTGESTTVYAQDLIIDDSGVTGDFGATNLFTINESNMSGWGFSITDLQVNLTCNHVTGSSIGGQVLVPIMESPFEYTASIEENQQTRKLDYTFTISPSQNIDIPVPAFNSTVRIHPSSVLQVQSINGEFRPKAILNGQWTFENGNTKIRDIAFQNLTVIHTAPIITAGTFSLVGVVPENNKVMRFPISLDQFSFNTTTQNQLMLFAQVSLNLGNAPNNFSVSTGLRVISQRQTNAQGRTTLTFNQFTIDNIAFSLNTTPFSLSGVIAVKKDDPVFGDLFYGSVAFKLNSIMDDPAMVSVGFGKMPDYKYWFVDAAVPVSIPIGATMEISQLYGGVMNRVRSSTSDAQVLQRVIGAINSPNTNPNPTVGPIPFIPDETKGLEFRAGVAIQNKLREEAFNGEAMFAIAFNPNGGFASIAFSGTAYMLVARAQRASNSAQKVYGTVAVSYDNNAKVFDAQVDAIMYVPNLLQGNINLKIHVDQNDWYFWLNRPANRANLTLVGMFNVNAYFMIGTQIDPLPPPPYYVTDMVGSGSFVNIDQTALTSGNGFLTGMQFNSSIYKELPLINNWYGYAGAGFGGGFDVMLMKVSPTAHCEGSTDPIGINRWYLMGQVYGYVNGNLGVKKIVDGEVRQDFNILSLSTAFLLQGRLPKPTFVYGALALRFEFLTFDINVSADVAFGNDCPIIY